MKYLQFIGPAIFLLVGVGFLVGAVVTPAGALTDDGYPRDTFFLLMGAGFGGGGVLWLGLAFVLVRGLDRAEAARAQLLQSGILVYARVIECEPTGYGDFNNRSWTNITFDVELPGAPVQRFVKHVALSQATIELAKSGRPVPVYFDPRDPKRFAFP